MNEIKLFPVWKHAVQQLIESGLTYGSDITRLQIAEMCELEQPTTIEEKERYDFKLIGIIYNIKASLLEINKMLLVSNNRGGYRVIMPQDQTAYTVDNLTSNLSKEFQRASDGIRHVNIELLDGTQRKQNADAQAKLSMLFGMQRIAVSELTQIARG